MKAVNEQFFILLIVALLFAGCGDDDERQVSQPPDDVEQELSQFSLVRMLRGRTKWEMKSHSATFLESDRVRLEGVELLIFGDKDGETLTIRGDRGEVNQRTNNIKITGNVHGVSSDGWLLTTEELYWRDARGRIYTPPGVEVTITQEDSVVVGEELDADPGLETVQLSNATGISSSEGKGSEEPAD